MHRSKIYKIIIAVLLGLVMTKNGMAESSKEYALMAKATWSTFECSVLAEKMNDHKEQERLFTFGYKQGLIFIDALLSDKIKREDLSSEAPIIMLMLLQGPTPDFMLGRVFDSALESALENVYKTGEHFNSDEEQKTIATNEYWKRNCQLIGK